MPISMTLSSGSFRLIIFTLIHTPHNGDCPRGWCPLSPVWVCALCSFAPSLATHWQYLEATAGAVSRLCKLSAEQQQLDIFNLAKQNNNLCKANIYSSGNKNRGIEQNELPMVPDELNVSNSRNKKVKNQNNQCHQLQINGVNIFSKTSGLCSKLWDNCALSFVVVQHVQQFTPLILKYCWVRLMLFMSTVSTGTEAQVTELQNNYHWPRCADAQQALQALQHCSLLLSNKEIERYAVMTYFGHLMDPRGSSQHPKLS